MRIIIKRFIFLIVLTLIPTSAYLQPIPAQPDTTQRDSLFISLLRGLTSEVVKEALAQRDSVPEGPIRFSVGSSFSFIDGLSANDVYANLYFFKPDVWSNFGLELGLAQGRSFSRNSEIKFTALSDSITSTSEEKINLSIYGNAIWSRFWLPFLWSRPLPSNLYLIGRVEFRKTELKTQLEMADSSMISISTSATETFYGIGLFFNYPIENVELQVTALVGGLLVKKNLSQSGVEGSLNLPAKRPNWLIQFRLREKDFGLNFGGEIRSRNKEESEILIYLSKEFSFTKFTQFLKP